MYEELLTTPHQRLLAHTLALLIVSCLALAGLEEQAGQQLFERRYAEVEFERADPPVVVIALDRPQLCKIRVNSPTVNQSWVDARVRILPEDNDRAVFDRSAHLSSYFSMTGGKYGSRRGEQTLTFTARLPAGRWRVVVTGEDSNEPPPGMMIGGKFEVGPDGQLKYEPGTWVPTPIFDPLGIRTIPRDEVVEVAIKRGVMVSGPALLMALLALVCLGALMFQRITQVERARNDHVGRVRAATARAIARIEAMGTPAGLAAAVAHTALPDEDVEADDHLSLPLVLAASLLISAALAACLALGWLGVT